VSIKQANEFLKKIGKRKNVSKFEIYKEDIIYLYNEGATLEIITQYLETKGIKRTKGYSALSSFVKRNISLKSYLSTQLNLNIKTNKFNQLIPHLENIFNTELP